MRKFSNERNNNAGFSLAELLMVIGVLGILAFIALPMLSMSFGPAEEVRAKRNAQTIASVAASAQAAGNLTLEQAGDLNAAVNQLHRGVRGKGPFADFEFAVRDLTLDGLAEAKVFLIWDDGKIHYAAN